MNTIKNKRLLIVFLTLAVLAMMFTSQFININVCYSFSGDFDMEKVDSISFFEMFDKNEEIIRKADTIFDIWAAIIIGCMILIVIFNFIQYQEGKEPENFDESDIKNANAMSFCAAFSFYSLLTYDVIVFFVNASSKNSFYCYSFGATGWISIFIFCMAMILCSDISSRAKKAVKAANELQESKEYMEDFINYKNICSDNEALEQLKQKQKQSREDFLKELKTISTSDLKTIIKYQRSLYSNEEFELLNKELQLRLKRASNQNTSPTDTGNFSDNQYQTSDKTTDFKTKVQWMKTEDLHFILTSSSDRYTPEELNIVKQELYSRSMR